MPLSQCQSGRDRKVTPDVPTLRPEIPPHVSLWRTISQYRISCNRKQHRTSHRIRLPHAEQNWEELQIQKEVKSFFTLVNFTNIILSLISSLTNFPWSRSHLKRGTTATLRCWQHGPCIQAIKPDGVCFPVLENTDSALSLKYIVRWVQSVFNRRRNIINIRYLSTCAFL